LEDNSWQPKFLTGQQAEWQPKQELTYSFLWSSDEGGEVVDEDGGDGEN
jgi:hypothetical protein